jgi:two-component system, cell cycle sensor histidine kinase and response regulator CckA
MVAIDNWNTSLKRRLHRLVGSRIEMVWVRGADIDPIVGEFDWVEQIVFDMALRARAALPYGGRVVVETANVELNALAAEVDGLTAGRYVMMEMTCLRQTPTVLPDSTITTGPLDFDSDLWLSSLLPESRETLQSLGGNICEYNEPGRALTLRAFFPSAATLIFSDEEEYSLTTTGPNTILLVEDESYVREVACEILESAGYTVLAAGTGNEALDVFEKHGPIKLLVTDVVMPGMNGQVLSDKLKKLQPDLKTIYMSGYTDNAVVRQDFSSSNITYIQKPFTLETLTSKVKQVLDAH